MKNIGILIYALLFAILITDCGGGGGGSNDDKSGNTSGVITLAGDDTATVGTQLNAGFIGASLAADLQPDHISIVGQGSSVTFTPPNILTPNINDPENWFIVNVLDDSPGSGIQGISMSIAVGGEKFSYACNTPVGVYIHCGTDAIVLDISNKTVTFDNATVENTDTSAILTLDGILIWSGGNAGNSSNGNTSGGALTDITGVWKDDGDNLYWTSTQGTVDEVYDVFYQDGTYLQFGYYANDGCYDIYSGTYEDFGNGNISLDGEIANHYSISGDTLTVSYLGDSYTATRSTRTESEFAPACN